MIKTVRTYLLLFIVVSLLISCSEYQKLLKSDNYPLKLEKAREYYNSEDYYRAMTLLDELGTIYRASSEAEEITYLLAKCHYAQHEYTLAAYYFKRFSASYPNSSNTEEADFNAAYCFYLIAPAPSLDQTYTQRGIDELQLFIERYPTSEKRDTANVLIDNLHRRLETKAYNNAKLFFDIGNYKAAISALKNVLVDYPDTKYREDAQFYILKASFLLAENSIEKKQQERFESTVNEYLALIDNFPQSFYVKEAERIYNQALKELNKYQ
jgi:outer membrane protein assembly factor BamD